MLRSFLPLSGRGHPGVGEVMLSPRMPVGVQQRTLLGVGAGVGDAQSQNAQRQEASFPKATPRSGNSSHVGKSKGQVTLLQHGRRAEGSRQAMPSHTSLSARTGSMVDLWGPCHCLSMA